jgi:hypothetical protein
MKRRMLAALATAAVVAASPALASYHTFRIVEVFSSADRTVQYVVLHESFGADGENLWGGHALTATEGSATRTFTFPNDLPGGSCDYYTCTPAPTANRDVLIATEGFAALGLIKPDYVIPDGFIPLSGTLQYADVPQQVTYSSLPTDGVSAIDSTGAVIPNVARNFSGRSASVSVAGANYQGLWWAAPAGSESGWGLNLAHQGDTLFVSWFTYDATGKGWWLVMTATRTAANTYSGKLYTTRGPAFDAVPWDPMAVVPTEAGTGTLVFTDANNATFTYVIGATNQTKSLTREVFGVLPTCTWGGGPGLAAATNYQDLWWKKPAASESGWGINLNHEGDTIFATWFTYDPTGAPLWLVATAKRTAPNAFSGDLLQTTGPPYNAMPFDPAKVVATKVGTATLTFSDGNNATFDYSVQLAGMTAPVAQSKAITREVFAAPGTACR